MATLFGLCVTILMCGALWFFIARPILEDWGFFNEAESSVVMSRSAVFEPRTAAEPPEPIAVLADTNQPEPLEPLEIELEREPIRLRQLPRRDLIIMLAVQRKDDGGYLFSSNQITSFVGGTAADVKALVAEVRGGKPAEEPKPRGQRAERPQNGWAS